MFRFSKIIENLISRKLIIIFWEIIREYFIGLWTYDHDRFTMTFGLNGTDITCTTLHVSGITCTTIYLSLDIITIYIVPWSWYTLFSLFDTEILDHICIMYTESHTILHLHWLIKLTKSGLLVKTVVGKIQGGMLGRVGPPRALPHVFLLFMRAPVITCYVIPEYSELFLPAIRIH